MCESLSYPLYALWLYAKIVSLGWHPFMRINKQENFRPKGEAKFRSLASAAPRVGAEAGAGIRPR
jgi:hypothetical protein